MNYRKTALYACILLFITMCLLHYLSRRPLWLDENFILNNIKDRNPLLLFGPLVDSQTFPRLYLAIISMFSSKFGYDVLALRFLPLLCMIAAFFVWIRIYRTQTTDSFTFLLAVFSMACSYNFGYYAAELKQYSIDVLVSGLFCAYMAAQCQAAASRPSRAFAAATFLLPLALLVSYAAFFFFWIAAYNYLIISTKNRNMVCLGLAYSGLCAVCIVFVCWTDIRHTMSTPALFSYWNDYFISADSISTFFSSLSEGVRKITALSYCRDKMLIRIASVFIPFFIIPMFLRGAKTLKRDAFKAVNCESIGLVVFIQLLVLGMAGVYPFTGGRLTLFFAPFVFFYIVKGIGYLRKFKPAYIVACSYYILALCAFCFSSFRQAAAFLLGVLS